MKRRRRREGKEGGSVKRKRPMFKNVRKTTRWIEKGAPRRASGTVVKGEKVRGVRKQISHIGSQE